MIKVVPSILANNLAEAKELLIKCEGAAKRVSIDIIDGKFADNKTIEPSVLSEIDTDLKIDFHLMVQEPINWVEKCVLAGADRIIGHIEHMSSQVEFVGKVQEAGALVGLAIDLDTPVSKLDSVILNGLDVVLIMSVQTGFGGQKFDKSVLKKVKKLDEIRLRATGPEGLWPGGNDMTYKIHIDGGIIFDNINSVRKAGADEVSVGRRLFEGDLKENIKKFTEAAYC